MSGASAAGSALPAELDLRRLRRRAALIAALLVLVTAVVVLAPGLDALRAAFSRAAPGWVGAALALEALSCMSYVLMFRPVFCRRMTWRRTWQIGWSELAMGSIVPASGAGGLALGAWVLKQAGMDTDRIARRSVAFFLIKSSVNFAAVALLGALLAMGLLGPELPLWLTALPAVLSLVLITVVILVPRLGPGADVDAHAGRTRRAVSRSREAIVGGTAEAVQIVRSRDVLVLAGALGYWIFDNAVLYATFRAFGESPDVTVVLMGYLIGQLGGLLPIPGGVGGIDGGLIGALVLYGTPIAATAAAVLAYRAILFWLPLLVGGLAFASLGRAMAGPGGLSLTPAGSGGSR